MNGTYMNELGQYTSAPSRQASVTSPTHQTALPMRAVPSPFNPAAQPLPYYDATDMTIYQQYTASPAQLASTPVRSPYPVLQPISLPQRTTSTEYVERTLDPQPPPEDADYAEFLAWKRQMHQAKQMREQASLNAQMQNTPFAGYPDTAGHMLPRYPAYMLPVYHHDLNVGFPYETLGQAHGLPGQRPQNVVARPTGHYYGETDVRGNARLIRGNVLDSVRPNVRGKSHEYSDRMSVSDDALVWDGDQTEQTARMFWNKGL